MNIKFENTKFEKICVIGLGYIGLPTAAVIANRNIKVIGVDVNPHVVETLNSGRIHITEPDLDVLVRAAVHSGNLRATLNPEAADVFVIAVPTPFKGDDHEPDLSYVRSAVTSLAPVLKRGDAIILESTSPVGTTAQICLWLAQERPDLTFPHSDGDASDIRVAYCPERVLPGHVLRELVENARIIGGVSELCSERAAEFYRTFVMGDCISTNSQTAEMAKLVENASRDVNIAFANELSLICEKLHVDVWELIQLANQHPRVNILQPGPGVGGHCIAVDPWFIVHSAPDLARMIKTARLVNDEKPHWVVEQVKREAERFKSPRIACLGLSFKANIDDLRESPSVDIVRNLLAAGVGQIDVVEPFISCLPPALQNSGANLRDLRSALADADIVVGLVDHAIFRKMNRSLLDRKIVIDTRGMWR